MTFSYELHARRDVLVNPKIYKLRTDVSWEEVQHNYMIQKKHLTGNTIFITYQTFVNLSVSKHAGELHVSSRRDHWPMDSEEDEKLP